MFLSSIEFQSPFPGPPAWVPEWKVVSIKSNIQCVDRHLGVCYPRNDLSQPLGQLGTTSPPYSDEPEVATAAILLHIS